MQESIEFSFVNVSLVGWVCPRNDEALGHAGCLRQGVSRHRWVRSAVLRHLHRLLLNRFSQGLRPSVRLVSLRQLRRREMISNHWQPRLIEQWRGRIVLLINYQATLVVADLVCLSVFHGRVTHLILVLDHYYG